MASSQTEARKPRHQAGTPKELNGVLGPAWVGIRTSGFSGSLLGIDKGGSVRTGKWTTFLVAPLFLLLLLSLSACQRDEAPSTEDAVTRLIGRHTEQPAESVNLDDALIADLGMTELEVVDLIMRLEAALEVDVSDEEVGLAESRTDRHGFGDLTGRDLLEILDRAAASGSKDPTADGNQR